MTKQEALQKIEELKAFIEQEDNKPWKPKDKEDFWFINEYGDAQETWFARSKEDDVHMIEQGNFFKTEEQAKKSFKYWAMNQSEYEYSLPYAPETWFEDYKDCEVWDEIESEWVMISGLNPSKEYCTYRRKRK